MSDTVCRYNNDEDVYAVRKYHPGAMYHTTPPLMMSKVYSPLEFQILSTPILLHAAI